MINEYFTKTLIKIIKAMKCDIYIIGPDYIIGSNKECSYISEVTGLTNGMNSFYENNPNIIIEITKNTLLEIDNIIKSNENEVVDNYLWQYSSINGHLGISNIMEVYIRTKNNLMNRIPDYFCNNLKDITEFNEILMLKAADGAKPLHINSQDTIFIYPGLLGINKSDQVSLKMFRNIENGVDVCEFDINKKFITIHKYIGYLSLR